MVLPLKDYWDGELIKPKEIFEQNGFGVTIVSSTMNETKSMLGNITKPDTVLDKVKLLFTMRSVLRVLRELCNIGMILMLIN